MLEAKHLEATPTPVVLTLGRNGGRGRRSGLILAFQARYFLVATHAAKPFDFLGEASHLESQSNCHLYD